MELEKPMTATLANDVEATRNDVSSSLPGVRRYDCLMRLLYWIAEPILYSRTKRFVANAWRIDR